MVAYTGKIPCFISLCILSLFFISHLLNCLGFFFSPDILMTFVYCLLASIFAVRKSVVFYKWSIFPAQMLCKIFLSLVLYSFTIECVCVCVCVCSLSHLRLFGLPHLGLVFSNNSQSCQISLQIATSLFSLISFQTSRWLNVRHFHTIPSFD